MDIFKQLINALPSDRKSYRPCPPISKNCALGWPAEAQSDAQALLHLDADTTGFEFLLGHAGKALVAAYASSVFPAQTEHLVVGDNNFSDPGQPRDLSALIAALHPVPFPRLQYLYLGDYFSTVNGGGVTHYLGDITPLLHHAKNLKALGLVGHFTLTQPLHLPHLSDLTIELDDYETSLNAGPISNATLNWLLSSHLPQLAEVFLDLSIDSPTPTMYQLPARFLQGHHLPALKKLEITGHFAPGQREQLLSSPLAQRPELHIDIEEMHDSCRNT